MISNSSKHHPGIENIIISILVAILCLFLSLSIFTSRAKAKAGEINVYLDEAKLVRVNQPVSQIIIGNPAIADVRVQSRHMLVFIGKSPGSTNIILLDKKNNEIFNREVNVTTSPSKGLVMVYRGSERFSYHCGTVCNGQVQLGDSSHHVQDKIGAASKRLDFIAKAVK